MREAVLSETAPLAADARALLDGAAIVGDPFEIDFAAEVAGLERDGALVALDALVAADLVQVTGDVRRFRFRHPIVRRTVGPDGSSNLFILGADSTIGRDLFLRLLYGAQTSLEVAVFATFFAVFLGVLTGALAGYFRGGVDTVISRLTEMIMAFPALLFIIAISATAGEQLNGITFGFLAPGVFTLVLIFALFGWFYPARIVRGQVLSLREKEFVEAARMTGATDWRIIKSHLIPHLVGPVIVYSTLIVATNIIAEAGLSFLGLGIQEPTSSWGNILSRAPQYYLTQPNLMIWPGLAILLATLAFNLLGDGLRDAFDPRKTS